jgi:hypothetical protein
VTPPHAGMTEVQMRKFKFFYSKFWTKANLIFALKFTLHLRTPFCFFIHPVVMYHYILKCCQMHVLLNLQLIL